MILDVEKKKVLRDALLSFGLSERQADACLIVVDYPQFLAVSSPTYNAEGINLKSPWQLNMTLTGQAPENPIPAEVAMFAKPKE